MTYFSSYTALRANTTNPTEATVGGYSTVLDGGEGSFLLKASDTTSVDNDGTILVNANGKRYHRIREKGHINVKWFGAKGDGVADDLSEITAAIACVASDGGGDVIIPNGNYCVSGTIVIGNGTNSTGSTVNNIKLIGRGCGDASYLIASGATDITYTGATAIPVIKFQGAIRGSGLSGIRVNGSYVANPVIEAISSYSNTWKDMMVINPCNNGTGVLLYSSPFTGQGGSRVVWERVEIVAQTTNSVALAMSPAGLSQDWSGGLSRHLFNQCEFYADGNALKMKGSDNHMFAECYFHSASSNPIRMDQDSVIQAFPHEHYFANCACVSGTPGFSSVAGTSGNWGNHFFPMPSSDWFAPTQRPTLDHIHYSLPSGFKYVDGNRQYEVKTVHSSGNTNAVSTTGSTFVTVPDLTQTFTTKADTKLRISYSIHGSKVGATYGYFKIYVDGTDVPQSARPINVVAVGAALSCETFVDVAAGSHTVEVRFNSADSNANYALERTLVVEELY